MKKIIEIGIVLVLTLSSINTVSAARGDALIESKIAGIPTATLTVRGVGGGLLPWVSNGSAELDSSGKLEVKVSGLLFSAGPPSGTVGPITHVRASLTCEVSGVVATTAPVLLDSAGDAEIDETITLPTECIAPIVLIRIGGTVNSGPGILGPWIAATGF